MGKDRVGEYPAPLVLHCWGHLLCWARGQEAEVAPWPITTSEEGENNNNKSNY